MYQTAGNQEAGGGGVSKFIGIKASCHFLLGTQVTLQSYGN